MSMNDGYQKHYDTHTLFIKCESATSEQIRESFVQALKFYKEKTGENIDTRFKVNLITDKQGNSFGIAFVYITNPMVYYMIIGKNPDGSDRIQYVDDPSWEPPEEGELTNSSGWSSLNESTNWADICDEEDELEIKESRKICPKIPIQLEPLMTLPPYKLTKEQMDEKRKKIISENEGKQNFNSDIVCVQPFSYLSIERAMVTPVDNKFMPNIIKTQKVPIWITKEILKSQFRPYASDSNSKQERLIRGNVVIDTYPFVNINDDRVAFIIFDPSTRDAQFALHMMKKTIITMSFNKNPQSTAMISKLDGSSVVKETDEKYILSSTLFFSHSYFTDRDCVSQITKQPRPSHIHNKKPFSKKK